jgi:hypothetical protein
VVVAVNPSVAKLIDALAGRRIGEHAIAPAPADPGELAALREQLTASQAEIRRVLNMLAEREKTARTQDEDLIRLRLANERLADRAVQPTRVWMAPSDPDEALTQRAAQDRRNAVQLERRVRELETLVEALRAGVPA